MVVGHIGILLAARSWRPDAPLAWLLVASFVPDVLDVAFAVGGVCNRYGLYSHSLPAIAVVALLLAVLAYLATRSAGVAAVVGAVALLHVPADYLTGEKIAWPHGPLLGLFLYRWPLADFLVEVPFIVAGWWLVRRAGAAPRWMTARSALLVLLATQAALDVSAALSKAPRKPKGPDVCADARGGDPAPGLDPAPGVPVPSGWPELAEHPRHELRELASEPVRPEEQRPLPAPRLGDRLSE